MNSDPQSIYRHRIYGAYVSGRNETLAPETLDGLAPRLPYLRWMVRTCLPLRRDATILDLGCGHGAIVHALRLEGFINVRGVDGSLEQVEAGQRLGIEGIEHGDLMDILRSIPDASLECVITFDVIEHFTRAELIPLVDEVRRVLMLGGRRLIHAPNCESPFGGSIRYGDYTHEQAFTRASLVQLCLSSGFASLEAFEDCPIPHGIKSTVRAVLWRVIRALLLFYNAVETGSLDRRAVFSRNLLAVAVRG